MRLELSKVGPSRGMRTVVIEMNAATDMKASLAELLGDGLPIEVKEGMLCGVIPLVFESDCKHDSRKLIGQFLTLLSKEALDFQSKELGLSVNLVKPPFVAIHTVGDQFTGQELFFEMFNYVVATPRKAKVDNAFAIGELTRHAFATYVFYIDNPTDLQDVVENYQMLPKNKTFLIPSSFAPLKDCEKAALEEGYRLDTVLGEIL